MTQSHEKNTSPMGHYECGGELCGLESPQGAESESTGQIAGGGVHDFPGDGGEKFKLSHSRALSRIHGLGKKLGNR